MGLRQRASIHLNPMSKDKPVLNVRCLGRLRLAGARPVSVAPRVEQAAGAAIAATADKASRPDRLCFHDHFVHLREDALHRVDIDSPACDLRCLFILGEDRREPLRLALSQRDHLLLVGFAFLDDAGCASLRLRHDLVGIGLRLVAHAV